MKWTAGIAALLLVPVAVGAAPPRFRIEPVAVGLERLDALYVSSGIESRHAARLGTGFELWLRGPLSLGGGVGIAAGSTDFGLYAGPSARLVRTDAFAELRGHVPGALHGFGVQVAAGGGRLRLAYHPDHVEIPTDAGPIGVDLAPLWTWTRHVAAEVLHGIPGGEVGMRAAWRFYTLDVATPSGVESRAARDVQLGLVLRISIL